MNPPFLNSKMEIKYFSHSRKSFMFCTLAILVSCDSFLAIPPSKTELLSPVIFNSNSTANAAITLIYSRMINEEQICNMAWLTGLSADEFTNFATSQSIVSFYNNSLDPTNPNLANYLWTPAYSLIYQANAIIEGLTDQQNHVDEVLKKQIVGEALFVRAFWHFYLASFFGDVPIASSTDYRQNASSNRSSVSNVYKQSIDDLIKAKYLLPEHYVGRDGLAPSIERVRPNRAVAQALLARIYLHANLYENAEQEASEVLANQNYGLVENLNSVFSKNSRESIWQLQPMPNAITPEGKRFVLVSAPNGSGIIKSLTVSTELLNRFDDLDKRKELWLDTVIVNNHTYIFPYKYKQGEVATGNSTEYSMVLRLAEQYLIRAEARLRLQKNVEAIDDLNVIRKRAGLPMYSYEALSNIGDAILIERQREFFSEGHRWFDLIRLGAIDEIMLPVSQSKGGTWSTYMCVFPIPETERNANPNLTQNDGY